jgi:hypothetical protein
MPLRCEQGSKIEKGFDPPGRAPARLACVPRCAQRIGGSAGGSGPEPPGFDSSRLSIQHRRDFRKVSTVSKW